MVWRQIPSISRDRGSFGLLEGLGSIQTQACKYSGKGSYCKGIQRLELNASQGS